MKVAHLNGGKDGRRASPADGKLTNKRGEILFLYVGRTYNSFPPFKYAHRFCKMRMKL
jgi:hypothetical protein